LLKRGVVGIYHSMSDKHLQRYVDEFVFRYNTRNYSESNRFDLMLNNLVYLQGLQAEAITEKHHF
jgi:hypothetical protein